MINAIDIRHTRIYQDAVAEGEIKGEIKGEIRGEKRGEIKGKIKAVPLLLQAGISVEKIAQELQLDLSIVLEAVQESQPVNGG